LAFAWLADHCSKAKEQEQKNKSKKQEQKQTADHGNCTEKERQGIWRRIGPVFRLTVLFPFSVRGLLLFFVLYCERKRNNCATLLL